MRPSPQADRPSGGARLRVPSEATGRNAAETISAPVFPDAASLCYSAPQRSARCASSKNQKGATSMKQLTSALNNWWWRDANPVGRR